MPLCDPDEKPCVILVNLHEIHPLFEDPAVADYSTAMEDDSALLLSINVYHQCGFKSAGHIQVNKVPVRIAKLIGHMNNALGNTINAGNGEEDDENAPPLITSPITGVNCQFYKTIMYRVHGTTNTHDA